MTASSPRRRRLSFNATQRPDWMAFGLAFVLATACGGRAVRPEAKLPNTASSETTSPDATPGGLSAKPDTPYPSPARLFPLRDPKLATHYEVDSDGSRRFVVRGMRVVERLDGSVTTASEVLPSDRRIASLELPARLGNGFLFYTAAAGSTSIWSSESWTGKLKPVARLDVTVDEIIPGFDRLYLQLGRHTPLLALDLDSGESVDLGPLPSAPGYEQLTFVDAWVGAVVVPVQGVLSTFDAGGSWHPVPGGQRLTRDGDEVLVEVNSQWFKLNAAGLTEPQFAASTTKPEVPSSAHLDWGQLADEEAEAAASVSKYGPLGNHPLRTAVLRGFPERPGIAVVAKDGALVRVRLEDARVLEVQKGAFPESGACQGVPLGQGFGFICSEERESSAVYVFEPPFSLRPRLRFSEPRYIASSGNGALVIRGGCRPNSGVEAGQYCIVGKQGQLREVRVRGDSGIERVVALSDGRVAVIVPPRDRAPAALVLVNKGGRSITRKLRLPSKDPASALLLKRGLWLDGFVEHMVASDPGSKPSPVLKGWVVSSGEFVGVEIGLDGKVQVGPIQDGIKQSLLSGLYGMIMGRGGTAAETVDGGQTFREVELPQSVDPSSPTGRAALGTLEQGCSRLGCAFGSWVRVGYGGHDAKKLPRPPLPARKKLLSPGGARWSLRCRPTGELSPKALPGAMTLSHRRGYRSSVVTTPDRTGASAFEPFFEVPSPKRGKATRGFEAETTDVPKLRAYVWGDPGADWLRTGSWLVRVADRFSVEAGVWSTAVTRSPWADEVKAGQVFGYDIRMGFPRWSAALDPSGRRGILSITASSGNELYVIEEGRPILPIQGADQLDRGSLAGAVKLENSWYFGYRETSNWFRLYRVEGNRLRLLRQLPIELQSSLLDARLVRTRNGDALGLWVNEGSWFVYPISRETGEVGQPLEITPKQLASTPAACSPDDPGWLLTGSLSLSPYIDFSAEAGPVSAQEIAVRVVASAAGVCLEALAAEQAGQSRARFGKNLARSAEQAADQTFPLTLTERGEGARRLQFECHN